MAAAVIDSAFPIVAIVGLVTPRLFVARSVLEACSAEELEAVLAHEEAHARQRDNLRRLALAGAPDLLGLWPAGRQLEGAWMRAAEFAADEAAADQWHRGLHLASALVKVARLATTPSRPLPASALYHDEPITERVQRLLDPPLAMDSSRWPTWARVALPAALTAGAVALVPLLHAAGEQLIALGR
jgi:Zn-dependent protease with chaperone function